MGKIAFIYPGQGAQANLMGKDFFDSYEEVRAMFDKASSIMEMDMAKLCFDDDKRLDQTRYTQSALFLVSMAITKILEEKGLSADMTAGLSLGEYCAICKAGAITFEDGIKALKVRGKIMEEAVPGGQGAMSAVLGLDPEEILKAIENVEGVTIANYNTPKQTVITGLKEDMTKAHEALKLAGAKMVKPLVVSGPFHSPYLNEASLKLEECLDEIEFGQLKIPYVANYNGLLIEDRDEIKDLLVKQICGSVMWYQSVLKMIEEGVTTFIEIGPGKTLSNMIKKIDRSVKIINVSTIEDIENIKAIENIEEAVSNGK